MKDYETKEWLKPTSPSWLEWVVVASCGVIFAIMIFLGLSA